MRTQNYIVNRENTNASVNDGNSSTNPVWNSHQKLSCQINGQSIYFSKVTKLHCNNLCLCTSHFHADGWPDSQSFCWFPVGNPDTSGNGAGDTGQLLSRLPCWPNHGLYTKTLAIGKEVSVSRMDYTHARMKLPKNKSKKKGFFKKDIKSLKYTRW